MHGDNPGSSSRQKPPSLIPITIMNALLPSFKDTLGIRRISLYNEQ